MFVLSLCLSVSLSPCLRVSPSLCLSLSLTLSLSHSLCLSFSLAFSHSRFMIMSIFLSCFSSFLPLVLSVQLSGCCLLVYRCSYLSDLSIFTFSYMYIHMYNISCRLKLREKCNNEPHRTYSDMCSTRWSWQSRPDS